MKIAVIGGGITGMGTTLALAEHCDVHLFEADTRFGGHANTAEVAFGDRVVPVDTGFIVFNDINYPNLVGLFAHLDVPTKASDMSFGLSAGDGWMEYGCDTYDQLFAQRRNLLSPRYVRGMRDILRFNREAPGHLANGKLRGLTLGQYLAAEGFSTWFRDYFVLAFGGAIWSTPTALMMEFPAESFVLFFQNHGLMNGMSPAHQWRTVDSGSTEYVSRLVAKLGARAHCGARAVSLRRAGGQAVVRFADGSEDTFDQVVLACHGPQARALVQDLDPEEREILSAFKTSPNRAVLHSDPALMPKRRKVWSSWNFLSSRDPSADDSPASVTYWMQRLQGIDPAYPLFVSLNPRQEAAAELTHQTHAYDHPVFDSASFAAQRRMEVIQGRGGVWYAGAWLGYGFHEDGLRSGLSVAHALGARPAWAKDLPAPAARVLAQAAE